MSLYWSTSDCTCNAARSTVRLLLFSMRERMSRKVEWISQLLHSLPIRCSMAEISSSVITSPWGLWRARSRLRGVGQEMRRSDAMRGSRWQRTSGRE